MTVCPNDAFFRLPTPEGAEMSGRQQYFVLAELCNECGNCMVFCPENGDPAQVKPKLYLDGELAGVNAYTGGLAGNRGELSTSTRNTQTTG